jgi:RNA polymerase sigma factor (sigma-70 family)
VLISQACNEYHALVHRYACKYTHDADDLAQDVMLKVCRFWTHEQETWTPDQVRAWLWQITRRTAIDAARREKLHTLRNLELTDCHYASTAIESDVEQRILLNAALSRLPKGQRATLLLSVAGYHGKEMETREKLTAAGIKGRLNRARKSLAAFREEWDAA